MSVWKTQAKKATKKAQSKHALKSQNCRVIAAKILLSIIRDEYTLDAALNYHLSSDLNRKDAAFVQELCYGSLRYWIRLQAIVNTCMERPLRNKDADINALLILGLYQLVYMRVPDHAALSETVNAVVGLKKNWAKKLVNGVLRTLQRTYSDKLQALEVNSGVYHNHPDWMLDRFKQQWPQHWQGIIDANDNHPPMVLRVNTDKISVLDCLAKLAQEGIDATEMKPVSSAIHLKKAIDVSELPIFRQGLVSVQDAAAQLAAPMLALSAAERVLDMCAAPGGKTGHILESQRELAQVIAVEIDLKRCERIHQNLDRLGYEATVLTADATDVDAWWDKTLFDKILLDVPCSASGVIRRHPDIKMLRTPQDVERLRQIQQNILAQIWPTLRPGGMLLYVTCSIFDEENESQIQQFLSQHDDAIVTTEKYSWGHSTGAGLQILPGEFNMDGFYFCRLQKSATGINH